MYAHLKMLRLDRLKKKKRLVDNPYQSGRTRVREKSMQFE